VTDGYIALAIVAVILLLLHLWGEFGSKDRGGK